MTDNDMAEMMPALIEQNKATMEMMKNQSEKKLKLQVFPTWLKDQLKHCNNVQK